MAKLTTVTVVIKLIEEEGNMLFNNTNKQELDDAIRDFFEHNVEVASIDIVISD